MQFKVVLDLKCLKSNHSVSLPREIAYKVSHSAGLRDSGY